VDSPQKIASASAPTRLHIAMKMPFENAAARSSHSETSRGSAPGAIEFALTSAYPHISMNGACSRCTANGNVSASAESEGHIDACGERLTYRVPRETLPSARPGSAGDPATPVCS